MATGENLLIHWGEISNRRYCRWVNDRLLRELAPPLDAEEIGSLFSPPPWGERNVLTPFERITGAGDDCLHDMAAWEPFRNNVDMDKESWVKMGVSQMHYVVHILPHLSISGMYIGFECVGIHSSYAYGYSQCGVLMGAIGMTDNACMLKASIKPRSKKDESDVTGSVSAMKAWCRVERRAREALRRNFLSSLVEAFEDVSKGSHALSNREIYCKNCVGRARVCCIDALNEGSGWKGLTIMEDMNLAIWASLKGLNVLTDGQRLEGSFSDCNLYPQAPAFVSIAVTHIDPPGVMKTTSWLLHITTRKVGIMSLDQIPVFSAKRET
eukprot:Gb_03328 [translate_table: standard]